MNSALRATDRSAGTVTMDFTVARANGERIRCIKAESGNSAVIRYNPEPLPPLPEGYSTLGDFLDIFDADHEISSKLPEVRRKRFTEDMERNVPMTFRHLRLNAGLSQKELAEALGTSQAAVSAYESRTRKPGEDSIRDLAKIFSVDFNTLMQALENGQG